MKPSQVDQIDTMSGPEGSPSAIPLHFGATLMLILDRITTHPNRLGGEPCIRDLRLTVRRVVEAVALYPDRGELKREYPELDDEDIRQALAYAAASLDDKVLPLPVTP